MATTSARRRVLVTITWVVGKRKKGVKACTLLGITTVASCAPQLGSVLKRLSAASRMQ